MTTSPDFVMRAGLGRFGARLRDGGPATVAYLGGSITWGGNASDIERYSYRARMTQWLSQRFPRARLTAINAGIGGTGSDLGAYRLHGDVLRHQPDLVVLEFAVNDGSRNDQEVLASFEGIVRAIRRERPEADLCVVYTLHRTQMPDYEAGRLPGSVAVQEQVAEHYGLPSVHMARALAKQVTAGEVSWEVFSKDDCHPTDEGFAMFARTLSEALELLLKAEPRREAVWPEPLSPDPWEQASMRPVRADESAPGWQHRALAAKGGWDCFTDLLVSDQAGATVELAAQGRHLGLMYQLGPTSGDLDVAVDDGPPTRLRVFDPWAVHMWRPQYRIFATDLEPGPHRIRVTVAGTHDPRARGHEVRLGYVMSR